MLLVFSFCCFCCTTCGAYTLKCLPKKYIQTTCYYIVTRNPTASSRKVCSRSSKVAIRCWSIAGRKHMATRKCKQLFRTPKWQKNYQMPRCYRRRRFICCLQSRTAKKDKLQDTLSAHASAFSNQTMHGLNQQQPHQQHQPSTSNINTNLTIVIKYFFFIFLFFTKLLSI